MILLTPIPPAQVADDIEAGDSMDGFTAKACGEAAAH